MSSVYEEFRKDLPDVLVDSKKIIPRLFIRIPEFETLYEKKQQIGEYEIYFLK